MKRTVFIILLTIALTAQNAHCQFLKKETEYRKFETGLRLPLLPYISIENGDLRGYSLGFNPYFGYNLYKNLYGGVNFAHQWRYSIFHDAKDLNECGVYLRYVVPVRVLHIMNIYAGFACSATNYKLVDHAVYTYRDGDFDINEHYLAGNGLSNCKLTIPAGIRFHVGKSLYLDYDWQFAYFVNGTWDAILSLGVGVNFQNKN